MELVDGANYASELEQRLVLTKIFSAYDHDFSGEIDPNEFTVLVRDLCKVAAPNADWTDEVVGAFAAAIAGAFPGEDRAAIGLDEFVTVATSVPSPFDTVPYGQPDYRLGECLLTRSDTIIDMEIGRRADANAAAAGAEASPPPPFVPSYEWQPLPAGVVLPRGLETSYTMNAVKIPDPMQAMLTITSLSRVARIWAGRHQTLADLCASLVAGATNKYSGWPGQPVPRASELSLWHNGVALNLEEHALAAGAQVDI